MSAGTLDVEPLTPAIGATIRGVDLAAPLDVGLADAVYAALLEHLVLFFPGQSLGVEGHVALGRAFGELEPPHPIYPKVEGHPEVVLLENDAARPPDTNDWHTDLTFREAPPFASLLYAEVVPECGGDTLWSSLYAAWEALPAPMRALVADLECVHDMGSFRNDYLARHGGVAALNEAMARVGSAVHPVAARHPVTGRRFLNVNRSYARHLVGMSTTESDRLLAYLLDHLARPEFQVRHRWRAGTLAMWDNRVTQHYACADYLPHYRRMRRVTVIRDRRAESRPAEPAPPAAARA